MHEAVLVGLSKSLAVLPRNTTIVRMEWDVLRMLSASSDYELLLAA